MKKLLLVVLLSSYAFAADIMQVAESSQPLVGAIDNLSDIHGDLMSNYAPGYSVVIVRGFVTYDTLNPLEPEAFIQAVEPLVAALTPTVTGLGEGEWVSISATVVWDTPTFVTIRVKPDQSDSLEVWVDGVKR